MRGVKSVRLCEAAELNPRLQKGIEPSHAVSFVPMAALSAESAAITKEEVREYSEVSKGYTSFHNGDVLLAKITPCFENGKIAQANLSREIGFGSTEFHVLRPRIDRLDGRYLHHFLRQGTIRIAGEKRMTGSGGQRRVPESYLAELRIPLPPLPEQRRIAQILDKAEALRAKRRAALAKLESLAQSIFLEMFGDLATNPWNFPIKQMIEIVDEKRPISYGILMPGEDQEGGVKYVRVVDIQNGSIDHSKVRRTTPEISNAFKRSLLKAGDLLMSIRGHVGRLAIVPKELNGANITQDSVRLAIVDAVPGYVCEYVRTPAIQYWMAKHVKGVAVKGINLGDLKVMPVMLPPLPLQQAFARRVEAIESLKAAQRASLAKLDALFASLQHRAFRGEL